jgi:hypothetical protein
MSTQIQRRRGSTAEHATFTGANGEITVDTTKKTAVVHDGTTAGGIPLAKESALRANATAAEYRNKTASRNYGSEVWDALVVVALTDGATITADMNAGIDFEVTLAGNRTLGNPSNPKVGQRGRIQVKQDATGSRTLALGSSWKTAGGVGITLSTVANSIDYLDYDVVTSTHIRVALSKAWPA